MDFTGYFAIRPDALVGVGNHPDRGRSAGCCGPIGAHGPNRICACGHAVGTERSDCMWPVAVNLDPQAVRPVEPSADPTAGADSGSGLRVERSVATFLRMDGTGRINEVDRPITDSMALSIEHWRLRADADAAGGTIHRWIRLARGLLGSCSWNGPRGYSVGAGAPRHVAPQ